MAAGDIARETATRQNTLSSNLNILSAAGLIASRREGRSIIYSAAYERIADVIAFLVEDCCEGNPAVVAAASGAETVKCC